jgi:pyruvate/2-oxoglutarate/acetoin dehydrogenase E1 component
MGASNMAELKPEMIKKVEFSKDREQIGYREAIREALVLEMRRDSTIIVMGEDIAGRGIGYTGKREEIPPDTIGVAGVPVADSWGGPMGATKGLWWEFGPNRVRDTPITEAAFIGAGVGAAATGIRPVVELMFIDFCGVTMDQILNQAAKMRYMFGGKAKIPLVIRTTIGSGVRAAAQHSQTLYSIFVHIPGLKVVAPSTPYDAKGLLTTALRQDDPVVYCEHKLLYSLKGHVPKESYSIQFGKADVKKQGEDVTVVAISRMVHVALQALETLAKEGISVEVIDPRTLSPLDKETIIGSVKKTGRLVIVDEDTPRCSIATDIAALIANEAFDFLDAPIKCVTPPHTPVPFSPSLEDFYTPNAGMIVKVVKEITT